jgi:hypothetical protein
MCHPAFQDTAQRVVKGQAAVYFLRQQPHGSVWLLKKFSPSRRPSDEYLARVQECLPGGIEFFTCTQRRFLSADLVDGRYSPYRAPEFAAWLEGTLLMPKVPGTSWSVVADSLRSGEVDLTLAQRLRAAANLADCVGRLETAGCCHRDLSGSNVFLADDARIFVIDWDSLWHAQLPYQANTTVGTAGYIAPFTRSPTGDWDALRSWRPYADRYALAILIAEILLVSTALSDAQEDSTLFAQAQLEHPDGEFIRTQTDRLMQISIAVGQLFNEAVHAPSFDACPAPARWEAALRRRLRFARALFVPASSWSAPGSRRACTACGAETWVTEAWYAQLHSRGIAFLCGACRAARRRQRDLTYPAIACEHCQRPTRIARPKLEALRSKGSPVLCATCLEEQLIRWKQEQSAWERDHPAVICVQCNSSFRLRKTKLELLVGRGRAPLCNDCLSRARLDWSTQPPTTWSGSVTHLLSRNIP